jgi:hypothetical protein
VTKHFAGWWCSWCDPRLIDFAIYAYYPPPGYKYFLLLNIPYEYFEYSAEAINCRYLFSVDDWECYELRFRKLNSTHVYAFTEYPVYIVELYIKTQVNFPWDKLESGEIYMLFAVVEKTATLQEILNKLG